MEDRLRLEQQLIALRWIVAAFGAVQVGFAIRDAAHDPGFVVPLGVAIVVGLVMGNLLIARATRSAEGPGRLLGVVAFGLDATALLGLIWIGADGPARSDLGGRLPAAAGGRRPVGPAGRPRGSRALPGRRGRSPGPR